MSRVQSQHQSVLLRDVLLLMLLLKPCLPAAAAAAAVAHLQTVR
jgi:hypothetical protein